MFHTTKLLYKTVHLPTTLRESARHLSRSLSEALYLIPVLRYSPERTIPRMKLPIRFSKLPSAEREIARNSYSESTHPKWNGCPSECRFPSVEKSQRVKYRDTGKNSRHNLVVYFYVHMVISIAVV